jgi:glycogen synthase kinase 3 beta
LQIAPNYQEISDLDHVRYSIVGWNNSLVIAAVEQYFYPVIYDGISASTAIVKVKTCYDIALYVMNTVYAYCPTDAEAIFNNQTEIDILRIGPNKTASLVKDSFIGKGSMGRVYKGHILETGEPVAVKVITGFLKSRNHEVDLQKSLRHPNVLRILYAYESSVPYKFGEKDLIVVMEYMSHSFQSYSLHHRHQNLYLPRAHIKILAYQMFRAIAYLHDRGLFHCDIKPDNFLVDNATFIAKLADFGSTKNMSNPDNKWRAYMVTRPYRAPELLLNSTNYTISVDVWAAGVTLGSLWCAGRSIFFGGNNLWQLDKIYGILGPPSEAELDAMHAEIRDYNSSERFHGNWTYMFKRDVDPLALDLMKQIFQYDPAKRPTAKECMAHPYFDELREESFYKKNLTVPNLFNWTKEEKMSDPVFFEKITPEWYKKRFWGPKL